VLIDLAEQNKLMATFCLRNGHILSCSSGRSPELVENHWLYVKNGRVEATGRGEPTVKDVEEVDLEGRTVLPGLADSHLHIFSLGKATTSLNLEGCSSIEELQRRAREHLENAGNHGHFLEGLGWDQDLLGTTPSRWDLDQCVPEKPAVFYRRCHHVAVLNSMALKACSIGAETKDVDGGVIERRDGEPTGVLREKALELIEPLDKEESFEVQKDYLLRGLTLCVENGVTFVQSNDSKLLGGISRPWEAYCSLADESKLPCRVFLTVAWQDVGDIAPKAKEMHSSGLVSCDRAKIWTDGGLGAKTAAMLEPYADDPENLGVLQMTGEQITKAVSHLKEHGFRVEAHAIGDRAASELIDVFEKIMPPSERPVLTHCQFLNKQLVDRMSKGGIIANVQPQFVPSDLPIIKSRVGEGTERFRYAYVWRTLMKAGVHVAGGSDAPVEAPTPLIGMADAMEHALFSSEQMTLAEALSMYTIEAAFAARAEERIGSLERGKEADFVILSCKANAEALTASELRSCSVEKVYVRGMPVYPQQNPTKRPRMHFPGDGPGKSGLPLAFVRGRCPACSMSHRSCH